MDAWDEDDDDPLKVLDASPLSTSPVEQTISSLAVRQGIAKEDINRPSLDRLSSTEECDRQPQAAPPDKQVEAKTSKAASLKNAMVSKLSEKLGENVYLSNFFCRIVNETSV